MTRSQLEYFYSRVPLIEARRAYAVSQLEAAVRDFMTPKARPGEKKEQPTEPPRPNWKPEELLPYFASLGERVGVSKAALDDLRKHKAELPIWVLELIDLSLLN